MNPADRTLVRFMFGDTLTDEELDKVMGTNEQGIPLGDPTALTSERKKTHGDWMTQSATATALKTVVWDNGGRKLPPHQAEALEMILVKISRILCGDPNEPDHWDDIAGYAHLGKGDHDGNS